MGEQNGQSLVTEAVRTRALELVEMELQLDLQLLHFQQRAALHVLADESEGQRERILAMDANITEAREKAEARRYILECVTQYQQQAQPMETAGRPGQPEADFTPPPGCSGRSECQCDACQAAEAYDRAHTPGAYGKMEAKPCQS